MHKFIKVLIIADDLDDIETVKSHFSTINKTSSPYRFSINTTSDIREAEKHLVRNSFDVVLLDYIIPNSPMTATELIERVNAGGCRTPIILLTNLSDDHISWQVDASGAADHLNKQLDLTGNHAPRTLSRAVQYVIKHYVRLNKLQGQVESLLKGTRELVKAVHMNRR